MQQKSTAPITIEKTNRISSLNPLSGKQSMRINYKIPIINGQDSKISFSQKVKNWISGDSSIIENKHFTRSTVVNMHKNSDKKSVASNMNLIMGKMQAPAGQNLYNTLRENVIQANSKELSKKNPDIVILRAVAALSEKMNKLAKKSGITVKNIITKIDDAAFTKKLVLAQLREDVKRRLVRGPMKIAALFIAASLVIGALYVNLMGNPALTQMPGQMLSLAVANPIVDIIAAALFLLTTIVVASKQYGILKSLPEKESASKLIKGRISELKQKKQIQTQKSASVTSKTLDNPGGGAALLKPNGGPQSPKKEPSSQTNPETEPTGSIADDAASYIKDLNI